MFLSSKFSIRNIDQDQVSYIHIENIDLNT